MADILVVQDNMMSSRKREASGIVSLLWSVSVVRDADKGQDVY